MGRRLYGLSVSQISRFASAVRQNKINQAKDQLIKSQQGIQTSTTPVVRLSDLDFNEQTRIAHITFIETKQYRRIERYVTRDRVRYPIYSDWITKSKIIKKTIKLSNQVLESMENYDDTYITINRHEIILRLNNSDYYPSWFIKDMFRNEMDNDIKKLNEANSSAKQKNLNKIDLATKNNKKLADELLIIKHEEKWIKKRLNKATKRLARSSNKKNYLFLSIITFGIYSIFHSKRAIDKNSKKVDQLTACKNQIDKKIRDLSHSIDVGKEAIEQLKKSNDNLDINNKKAIQETIDRYNEKFAQVEPLASSPTNDSETFMMLKKLTGVDYKKIIGCYVIRNRENGKCYVGQSKDVLKRVCKQHFEGTKVKNIIFAEDYYTSKLENKDNLFEVRIIELKTKDELDAKEKELIEEYDSFKSGYNGTSGNS